MYLMIMIMIIKEGWHSCQVPYGLTFSGACYARLASFVRFCSTLYFIFLGGAEASATAWPFGRGHRVSECRTRVFLKTHVEVPRQLSRRKVGGSRPGFMARLQTLQILHITVTVIGKHRIVWLALVIDSPQGLTFTWRGCCGLCFWRKPTELTHSFVFCSCVYFCLYGPFSCI